MTTAAIEYLWMPVGGGVKPDSEVDWMNRFILGDSRGEAVAAGIDATTAKLPGLEWFDPLARWRGGSIARFARIEPRFSPAVASD